MRRGEKARSPDTTQTEWWTPRWLFESLEEAVPGLQFDLDPCSPGLAHTSWIPATRAFTKADDGLTAPWPAGAFVWLNPPYTRGDDEDSTGTGAWLARFNAHCAAGGDGLALVFERPDAGWFQRQVFEDRAIGRILWLKARVGFVDGAAVLAGGEAAAVPGTGTGSVLVAGGPVGEGVLRALVARFPLCGVLR